MNNPAPNPANTGFKITPGDVIFTLFRHKKKIIFFIVLGAFVGAAAYLTAPLPHVSHAKLLVRYVTEANDFISLDNETNVVRPGGRSNTVMNAELEILRSSDIARAVAEKVGPQDLLEGKGEGTEEQLLDAATLLVASNMGIGTAGWDSTVIGLSYSHAQPDIAQEVLKTTIEEYLKKHTETHRASDSYNNFLLQQSDHLKTRLAQTESELQRARQKAGVVNLADAKIALSQEIARIRQAVFQTDAELAEYRSALEAFKQIQAPLSETVEEGDEVESSSELAELANAIEQYESLRSTIDVQRSRERALLLQFTEENPRVKSVRAKINETEAKMASLVETYPNIRATAITSDPKTKTGLNPELEVRAQSIRIRALQSRSDVLKSQLAELYEEAKRIDEVEVEINELERRRALEEANYKNLVVSLESTRLEEDLRASRTNNISVIQSPSLGAVDTRQKRKLAATAGGGVAAIGLVWAFLVDLLLDRSIKRPTEIQRNLGIPLFMSLPDLNDKRYKKAGRKASRQQLRQAGKAKLRNANKNKRTYAPNSPTLKAAALSKPEEYGTSAVESNNQQIAPWDDEYALSEHFEALRDKVITYFESKNLTHKPKLIGMTGLGQESGVTTIASGLAGSLSKIGEGNVLLVDMTLGQETAQQFYKGKSILDLDQVLDSSDDAKMHNNLYVVAEGTNGTKLPRIMPQRFNKIMPKLRASDFDYIIFDMPPVSAISSTPRLASFMDVVLMVMESEETNRDVANQALELLSDSKAHLGGILNKTKSHVPRKLEQDLLSQA
ncbi:hypothetical protein [Pelagicoccus sp. SDUM812003]|uniref:exopolysaccharide transport family protein n=1 Tax=Pelagicoccus sp. SDUM812003 TaxID=3041267 RepID=UPI00280F7298|nr:hypothetical protein [Pelagicoccus sp. SDUM812003]MDQ8204982.1 hypothetical protein [Pelagicoccus sp. SDUM812003]